MNVTCSYFYLFLNCLSLSGFTTSGKGLAASYFLPVEVACPETLKFDWFLFDLFAVLSVDYFLLVLSVDANLDGLALAGLTTARDGILAPMSSSS